MRHNNLLVLSLFVLGANAALADGFIEHEKHVHGKAQLNIAIEKNKIEIEFSTPAMNLLGFEYKPSSTEDKHQLAQALTTLRQGGELFTLGTCQLKESEISSTLLDTDHDNNHPDDKQSNPSLDHDSEHDQHHQSNHSDFAVHYHFSCSEGVPAQIKTGLFVAFTGLQHIAVTVLGEQQSQLTLNKSQNVINLL
ncbi:hypothetical protein A9Q81_14605 [Gammaproteobacteria bacterium 42_54_T18]|nr:hypothetical protein A9Q81_14605 [Gammaproteobacteria bacterium 42_54_T18]